MEATERAAAFIHDQGGQVYVWLDESGLSHTTTIAPDHPVEFVMLRGAGFDLYQDASIASPRFWTLVHDHVLRRVEALWSEHGLAGGDYRAGIGGGM